MAEKVNLYEVDATGVNLRKLCGGGINNLSMESCVAAAILPGNPDAVTIGDSKLGADTPTLRFTRQELNNFFAAYQAGEIS
ncbi:uncharacterized protein DUF397 [Micromonospora pisi]|uniref:Uncharacterized protein DUF397 n=1 Tax=Micromonospora pisi TaxID=589240 RepID=A0A495JGK2_9ACTN|nr:DUF397 domain-containing protein [Micromonospora pisi]RKR87901.1 uncharacterized protein DUF397 [Micromonospora pisi]